MLHELHRFGGRDPVNRRGLIALAAWALFAQAAPDRGCREQQPSPKVEARPPGDPGANEGAAGRVNATAEEQQRGTDPAPRKNTVP